MTDEISAQISRLLADLNLEAQFLAEGRQSWVSTDADGHPILRGPDGSGNVVVLGPPARGASTPVAGRSPDDMQPGPQPPSPTP